MKSLCSVSVFILVTIDINSEGQNLLNRYKAYDTKQKKEIAINDIVKAMSDVEVLFFGELHNDSIGHLLQDTLLKALIQSDKHIALSLEVLSNDYQVILNEYLKDYLAEEDLERLACVWMPYYHNYKPLIKISKRHHLPVLAANVPNRNVYLVHERGMAVLDSLDRTMFLKGNIMKNT